jgi:hypothetical protein
MPMRLQLILEQELHQITLLCIGTVQWNPRNHAIEGENGLVLTTAWKRRGEAAVEEGNALALLLGVAGELVRRRTAGKSGGGATLGHGESLRAREIRCGGAARRLAASAGRPTEEARVRIREEGRLRQRRRRRTGAGAAAGGIRV